MLPTKNQIHMALAKHYAESRGFYGKSGYIYGPQGSRAGAFANGWRTFYHLYRKEIWAEWKESQAHGENETA